MASDLHNYLQERQERNIYNSCNWSIEYSKISGNGVFASKNFATGDLIFEENPIVIGPRVGSVSSECVVCLKDGTPLNACSKKCRLPVCSKECENSISHRKDCQLLQSLIPKEDENWSPLLYRALMVIRCLSMDEEDKSIVELLCANKNNKYIEINFMKYEMNRSLTTEEECWLERCTAVFNGTAFEIDKSGSDSSLRGLYPLAGTMNHSCCPNTRHRYRRDNNGQFTMSVEATVQICAGEELTTHYCPLLWGTAARRQYLWLTKEFLCMCNRCRDPTEFGTNLSTFLCNCEGCVTCLDPLDLKSNWQCDKCEKMFTAKQVVQIQTSPKKCFTRYIPKTNYLNVQTILTEIWKIVQHGENYTKLTVEELNYKEICIRVILDLIKQLRLGDTTMKDALVRGLCDTLNEKERRIDETGRKNSSSASD